MARALGICTITPRHHSPLLWPFMHMSAGDWPVQTKNSWRRCSSGSDVQLGVPFPRGSTVWARHWARHECERGDLIIISWQGRVIHVQWSTYQMSRQRDYWRNPKSWEHILVAIANPLHHDLIIWLFVLRIAACPQQASERLVCAELERAARWVGHWRQKRRCNTHLCRRAVPAAAGEGVCRDLPCIEAWRSVHCNFQQPAILRQGTSRVLTHNITNTGHCSS